MKKENTEKVKRKIFEEIQKISKEGIDEEELEKAKNSLKCKN